MSPAKGTPKTEIDERLAQHRDELLQEGESVVAQEMGDQGQAIILTNSRIFVIKAGLAATGQLNGLKSKTFMLTDVEAVRMRRGPMGAVIQVIDPHVASSNEVPPDNIVIFSGEQKIKKCESIAAIIEPALGKSLERVGPQTKAEPKESVVMDLKPKPRAKRAVKKAAATEEVETIETTQNIEPEMSPEQASSAPDLDAMLQAEAAKPKQKRKAKPKALTSSDYDFVNDIVEEVVKASEPEMKLEPIETKSKSSDFAIPESARQPKKIHMSLAEEMYADITSSDEYTAEVTAPIPAPHPVYTPPFDEIKHIEPENVPNQKIEDIKPEASESLYESFEGPFDLSVEINTNTSSYKMPVLEVSGNDTVTDIIYNTPKDILEDEIDQFRPNPLLPKPSKRKNDNRTGIFALLGLLTIVIIMSLAIIKINSSQVTKKTTVTTSKPISTTATVDEEQLAAIKSFKKSALRIANAGTDAASSLVASLKSGNCKYNFAVAKLSIIDKSSKDISELEAPAGLTGVKVQLTSSLFDLKNMADVVSNELNSGSSVDKQSAEKITANAKKQINDAINEIASISSNINH